MSLNYFAGFDSHPLGFIDHWKRAESFKQPDSRLSTSWFHLRHVPMSGDNKISVGVELISMLQAEDGRSGKEKTRLLAAREALMPLFLEYRAALLDLDCLQKSPADRHATARQWFLSTWLATRCCDAFTAIIDLPLDKLRVAALAFKPTTTDTFVADIETNAYVLKLIPADDLTAAISLRAVTANPNALQEVPGRLRTRKLCLFAMSVPKLGVHALEHVPVTLRDERLCDLALMTDGLNLQHVPMELLTVERCALACAQNGLAWDFVPKEARQAEVEFCVAVHGIHEKDSGQIYAELAKTDPKRAKAMIEKYGKMFNALHYAGCTEDELADLGLSLNAPAAAG